MATPLACSLKAGNRKCFLANEGGLAIGGVANEPVIRRCSLWVVLAAVPGASGLSLPIVFFSLSVQLFGLCKFWPWRVPLACVV